MIAALFVETNGVYYGLPNVDPWDIDRDARTREPEIDRSPDIEIPDADSDADTDTDEEEPTQEHSARLEQQ